MHSLPYVVAARAIYFEMIRRNCSISKHHPLSLLATIWFTIVLKSNATAWDPPLAAPSAASNGETFCNGFRAWLAPSFDVNDCFDAGHRLEYSDYAKYVSKGLEFHNQETPKTRKLPQILTPRNYTIATCTIFVSMLWSFPDQPPFPPLPGREEPHGPDEKNVVVSFREIFRALERIQIHCHSLRNTPLGWEPLGQGGSLGIFVMATDSAVARYLHNVNSEVLRSGLALESLGNSTVASS